MNIDDLTLGQIKSLLNATSPAVEICPSVGQYVIVRTLSAGVFAGVLRAKSGNECVLDQCRRLWKWHAAGGIELSGLATTGIVADKSRIGPPIDGHLVQWIEIIPAAAAKKSISEAPNAK